MSYFRKLIYSFLITLVLAIPVSLKGYKIYNSYNSYKPILSESVKNPQSKTVDVVAHVGGYTISSLSGWASPFAEVSLSSAEISRKTMADKNGFFIFNSVSLQDNPQELCLIGQDVNQLPSFPLCLAPPPRNQNIEIQDVLLSPTLSLENGKVATGKTTKASGMTFPRSKVQVYLFTERNLSFWAKIILPFVPFRLVKNYNSYNFYNIYKIYNFLSPPPAKAANFPLYETESNENGYFEFSLPANFPSNNRVFVSSVFSPPSLLTPDSQPTTQPHPEFLSPKSNTLSFLIFGLWGLLKLFLQNFFSQARSFFANWNDPLFIIMIEILILFGILAAIIAKKTAAKK